MALTDQTRKQLRQRLASRFGDVKKTTATSNGTTTTWVDALNVNSGAESYDGREMIFTSGANDGEVVRITGTAAASSTLTFTPAVTTTAADDTAEIYNKRGRGFTVQEYHDAINEAIEELNNISLIDTVETISPVFDKDTQTVAIPATLFEVYRVERDDPDVSTDEWAIIKRATPYGGEGWTAEPANAVIRIEGESARKSDDQTIRLFGYKRANQLTADSDVCPFDGTAVIAIAASYLVMAGIDRDPKYSSTALTLKAEADAARTRSRRVRKAGTMRVRL